MPRGSLFVSARAKASIIDWLNLPDYPQVDIGRLQMAKATSHKGDYRYWKRHSQAYHESGLSIADYCKANAVDMGQFKYYWQRIKDSIVANKKVNVPSPQFTPVTVLPSKPPMHKSKATLDISFILEFTSGIRCHVPSDFNSEQLAKVAKALS